MTSKGTQEMAQKIVIKKPWGVEVKDYKAGDPIPAGAKFKIFDAKDVEKIDAYADSLDESATYQKKRFKEPYYMYNESAKTIKESVHLSNEDDLYYWMLDYMKKNSKKGSTSLQFITDNGNSIIISWDMKAYNGITIDGKKMNMGEFCHQRMKGVGIQDVWEVDMNTGRFKPIKESSETKKDYLKYIDEFEKDVKKYIDWMKKDVKENKEVPLPEAVISLATAITNAMNRYNNAVKTKTLTEGFMVKEKLGNTYIGRFDSKDKAEKAVKDLAKRQGKSEADWVVEPDDKYMAAATAKGSSSWGPIPMNTLTESFIIQDSDSNNKPVYFRYGKYTGYDWGFDKKYATKFSTLQAAEKMIEKMRQEGVITDDMKVIKESVITESKYYIKWGKKYFCNMNGDPAWGPIKDFAIPFNSMREAEKYMEKMSDIFPMFNYDYDIKVVSEGRIAKGYENLDADEKARHLLSHPSSKYMNDLKSENITERAIRKAVKEMLGKPDKRDPQFITDVNEEGEAPAIANTTAEVANPDLPLKLKEGGNSWEMGNGDKIEVKSDVVIRTTKDGEKFVMSRKEWENGDSSNREPNWRKMKEATKVPYLLKNAKVGDTFHDGSDLGREYKITRVTPSKVYATCIKDPNVTGEYNRSHSDYNETDPQWAKLYTIK